MFHVLRSTERSSTLPLGRILVDYDEEGAGKGREETEAWMARNGMWVNRIYIISECFLLFTVLFF